MLPDPRILVLSLRHETLHVTRPGGPLRALLENGPKNLYYSELVRRLAAKKVVETGVCSGVSSSYLLHGLRTTGGHLWSIDLPTTSPGGQINQDGTRDGAWVEDATGTGCAVPYFSRSRWTLELGDSKERLQKVLADVGPVDLCVLDDDHSSAHTAWECRVAWAGLRFGGALVMDDVFWTDSWADFVKEVGGEPIAFPLAPHRQYMIRK